jgi:hypothetical protein
MNLRRLSGNLLALGGLLSLLAAMFYLADYMSEQRALRRYMESVPAVQAGPDERAIVETLTRLLSALPAGETTARTGYLNPLYDVLRARPVDVLRHGGFCGNKARLLVALLQLRGIPSRLVYMYNELGRGNPKVRQPYVTAFVEVLLGDRWVVADPLLGVLFSNVDGDPATAAELAATPELIRSQAPPWYDPELFDYRDLRGVRWAKFPGGEAARRILGNLFSEEWVHGLHYPSWVQRPNLLVAIGAAGFATLLLACGVWLRRSGRAGVADLADPVAT